VTVREKLFRDGGAMSASTIFVPFFKYCLYYNRISITIGIKFNVKVNLR